MRLVGLKEIRKQRGLNQQKVAMDLHITREALSQYENGKREPGQKMLIRMSEYFNVSIHYLITGHEFHKKHPGAAPALNQQSASFRTGGRFAARPCARFPEFPKGLFCILAPWHAVCKGRGANDRVARVKSAGAGQMSEIRCGAGRSSAKPRLR